MDLKPGVRIKAGATRRFRMTFALEPGRKRLVECRINYEKLKTPTVFEVLASGVSDLGVRWKREVVVPDCVPAETRRVSLTVKMAKAFIHELRRRKEGVADLKWSIGDTSTATLVTTRAVPAPDSSGGVHVVADLDLHCRTVGDRSLTVKARLGQIVIPMTVRWRVVNPMRFERATVVLKLDGGRLRGSAACGLPSGWRVVKTTADDSLLSASARRDGDRCTVALDAPTDWAIRTKGVSRVDIVVADERGNEHRSRLTAVASLKRLP